MKVFTILLIAVFATALVEASFLARVVKDAVDLGASAEATQSLDLDDPDAMRSALLSLGEEIIGTPTSSQLHFAALEEVAPKAVPLADTKPSFVEASSFAELVSQAEAEELDLIKKQEQEILADRAETSNLLQQFEALDQDVEAFDKVLAEEKLGVEEVPAFQSFADIAAEAENDKLKVRTVSEIEAEVDAEMIRENAAKLAAEAEKSLAEVSTEVETEGQADAEAEVDADAETEADTGAEGEAEAEAEGEFELDEVAFAELGVFLTEQEESSLEAYLAKVDSPTLEQEILEPTFLEEHEALEAESGQDVPMLSFLLTNEELTAELDHVAKQMQQQ